jgi:hypothetical protein
VVGVVQLVLMILSHKDKENLPAISFETLAKGKLIASGSRFLLRFNITSF